MRFMLFAGLSGQSSDKTEPVRGGRWPFRVSEQNDDTGTAKSTLADVDSSSTGNGDPPDDVQPQAC